jgi:hypothetical protein
MDEEEDEMLKSLVADGSVGVALGTLIANDKSEGDGLGALAGAALFASFRASQRAQLGSTPVYILENGNLYEASRGRKLFIKKIHRRSSGLPKTFDLD